MATCKSDIEGLPSFYSFFVVIGARMVHEYFRSATGMYFPPTTAYIDGSEEDEVRILLLLQGLIGR